MRPLRTISAALWNCGSGALPGASLPDDVVLVDGADDGLLFGNGAGERLFAVDVFFAGSGFSGDDGMPVVGDGNHDGVDVVARDAFRGSRG